MRSAADPVRIAKWTAIIAGGLVLLLAAAVFVATSVIDPNRYRGKVEAIVADLVGRPLVIEGDLQLTWYPWLGVQMGRAHFDNPPGVAGPPLAEWQSVTVAAKVLPLLKGEVVVDRIRLHSPQVHLRRDAQGRGNWENLGSQRPPSSTTGSNKPPPEIAGVEIREGMLDYVDEATGQQVSLSGLELDVGRWRAGTPLPVHAIFVVHRDSLPPAGVKVEIDAPELAIQLEPMEVRAPTFELKIADAQIKGDMEYRQAASATAHGSLRVHAPSVRKLAADFALNQTLPHDPTTLGPLDLTTQWSYADGAVTAKPLTLKLDEVNFTGWVEHGAPPASAWNFELHGDRIDLGRYFNVDSTNKKPFEIPVDTLRAINANGSVIFDHAEYADTHMSDIRLKLQTPAVQQ